MTAAGGSTGSGATILGLSFDFHDAAAAVVVDGRVVAAAEQERFSRVKHDPGLPEDAVAACLEAAGVTARQLDHVVFYEKPLAVAARFLAAKQREGPRSARSFLRDAPTVFGTNLMVGYRVAKMLRRLGAANPPALEFVEHHLSHAASAFYPSPYRHAAIVTVDGIGEWATATIGHGNQHRLTLLEEMRYPDSVGLVYSFVTAFCGFRPNDDEYKVMGLAPYGEPRYLDALAEIAEVCGDGSVRVDARKVAWYAPRGLRRKDVERRFDGPARAAGAELTQREADLAASVQRFAEHAVLSMANRAHELTGETSLCMAGGVALNCVANGKVLRDGPIERLWVQPAAGDAGGAVGAALAYWHLELGRGREADERSDGMSGGFLGPEVPADGIRSAVETAELPHVVVDDEDELAATVAARIDAGDIVGWFRGRMEFGPRALGHRSLLADPRSPTVRARLNAVTKGREEFRPFAPAVLADAAADWFELEGESPYMLVVAPVRAERMLDVGDEPETLAERAEVARSEIPACTHVDGSARIQTVDAATNPTLHRLIAAFRDRTGCPMLVNTSFNRAGEPIVTTVEQAIASARAGHVDLLVVGNTLIEGADLQGPAIASPGSASAAPDPALSAGR